MPLMQEDLRQSVADAIGKVLEAEGTGPLTLHQIQHRLDRDHDMSVSQEETRETLEWMIFQPILHRRVVKKTPGGNYYLATRM